MDDTQPRPVRLHSVREVAEMLDLHMNTVRILVRRGELTAYRNHGRHTRLHIDSESVRAYLRSRAA